MLLTAIADGSYASSDHLSGARAVCLTALSAALRRLNARCIPVCDDSNITRSDRNIARLAVRCRTPSDNGYVAEERETIISAAATNATDAVVSPDAALEAATVVSPATEMPAMVVPGNRAGLPPSASCRETRARKRALARGACAFQETPREGLKLLQAEGVLLPGRLQAREVAAFLRTTQGLDKASVGSYLGEAGVSAAGVAAAGGFYQGASAAVSPTTKGNHDGMDCAPGFPLSRDTEVLSARTTGWRAGGGVYRGDTAEFHAEVLEAFVESFDFRGQALLASLRMFLEAFRLPGEAQQIDRILHVSRRWHHR